MELKIYSSPLEKMEKFNWNHEELKIYLEGKCKDYMSLVYSENQVKEAKKDRASLRKLAKAIEDKRKEIKKEILVPYDDFAEKEKDLISIIDKAVENIDLQVKGYEEMAKQDKKKKIKEIYAEAGKGLCQTAPFEKIFKDSWLNAGVSLKAVEKEITDLFAKIDNEMKIISVEDTPYIFEMLEEYKKNFDLTAAMAKKQELEETAKRKQEFEEKKEPTVKKQPKEESPLPKSSRKKRVIIAITANESQFDYLNSALIDLRKNSEKMEILENEDL